MKKSKWLALAGVSLLSVGVLVACSSKSNTSSNTYNYVYNADPETLDYLISNKGSTIDAVTNGVDGLLENDKLNMVTWYLLLPRTGLFQLMV